jgi:hypothetical protein
MAKGRWYDSDWPFRMAAYAWNTTTDATIDVEITISSANVHFWENVQADGDDIRVVTPSGTLLTYDIASFDYANRTVTIEIDNWAHGTAGERAHMLWIYYGNASALAANTSFAPASAKSGQVTQALNPLELGPVIPAIQEQPGATQPSNVIAKASSEALYIVWDVTDRLADSAYTIEGSMGLEAVTYATKDVQTGGVTVAAMYDSNEAVQPVEYQGRMYLLTFIQAGTSGTNYTLILKFGTSLLQICESRCLIKVYDVSEA